MAAPQATVVNRSARAATGSGQLVTASTLTGTAAQTHSGSGALLTTSSLAAVAVVSYAGSGNLATSSTLVGAAVVEIAVPANPYVPPFWDDNGFRPQDTLYATLPWSAVGVETGGAHSVYSEPSAGAPHAAWAVTAAPASPHVSDWAGSAGLEAGSTQPTAGWAAKSEAGAPHATEWVAQGVGAGDTHGLFAESSPETSPTPHGVYAETGGSLQQHETWTGNSLASVERSTDWVESSDTTGEQHEAFNES